MDSPVEPAILVTPNKEPSTTICPICTGSPTIMSEVIGDFRLPYVAIFEHDDFDPDIWLVMGSVLFPVIITVTVSTGVSRF